MQSRLSASVVMAMAAAGGLVAASPVRPQPAPGSAQPAAVADPRAFLDFAVSSASLQAQASAIAVRREPRPEVKAFAAEMVAFRQEQASRLQALARERGWPLPTAKAFEHQVVLENLEPLDYLALSRRYAELQVQALEQEIRAYGAAEQAHDEGVRRLAQELLPALRHRLESAYKLKEAVGP